MFSIYILTFNEELDIAPCIDSVIHSAEGVCSIDDLDVIVVDSLSVDRTYEIATHYSTQYPVRVLSHAFESHGKQRTWMIQTVETRYPWA